MRISLSDFGAADSIDTAETRLASSRRTAVFHPTSAAAPTTECPYNALYLQASPALQFLLWWINVTT